MYVCVGLRRAAGHSTYTASLPALAVPFLAPRGGPGGAPAVSRRPPGSVPLSQAGDDCRAWLPAAQRSADDEIVSLCTDELRYRGYRRPAGLSGWSADCDVRRHRALDCPHAPVLRHWRRRRPTAGSWGRRWHTARRRRRRRGPRGAARRPALCWRRERLRAPLPPARPSAPVAGGGGGRGMPPRRRPVGRPVSSRSGAAAGVETDSPSRRAAGSAGAAARRTAAPTRPGHCGRARPQTPLLWEDGG